MILMVSSHRMANRLIKFSNFLQVGEAISICFFYRWSAMITADQRARQELPLSFSPAWVLPLRPPVVHSQRFKYHLCKNHVDLGPAGKREGGRPWKGREDQRILRPLHPRRMRPPIARRIRFIRWMTHGKTNARKNEESKKNKATPPRRIRLPISHLGQREIYW